MTTRLTLPVVLGNYANDGTGDDLRSAFERVNNSFADLTGTVSIVNGANVGSGTGVFAQRNLANLEFKSLTSTDNSVAFTQTATTVNLQVTALVESDTAPSLGGNLDINGYRVINTSGTSGTVETTVYGISVPILNSLMSLLVESGSFNIDLGTIMNPSGASAGAGPAGYNMDMGYFTNPTLGNLLNFGSFV